MEEAGAESGGKRKAWWSGLGQGLWRQEFRKQGKQK